MRLAQFNIGPYTIPTHIGDLEEPVDAFDGEIAVQDTSPEGIDAAVDGWLQRRVWCALDDARLPLAGHARLIFANGRSLEVFGLGAPIGQGLLHAIGNGIARAMPYAHEGGEGAVETILVSGGKNPNPYTGTAMAGEMLAHFRAIRLFPHAWRPGPYREAAGKIARSWCDAVPFHEALHAYVEPWMGHPWKKASGDFGWVSFCGQPIRIVYPSGHGSFDANTQPDRCPNAYAATDLSEDLIESLVAHLNDAPLDAGRSRFLRRLLGERRPALDYRIEATAPDRLAAEAKRRTEERTWRLQVRRRKEILFRPCKDQPAHTPVRQVPVEEFRRLWHAGERFGLAG